MPVIIFAWRQLLYNFMSTSIASLKFSSLSSPSLNLGQTQYASPISNETELHIQMLFDEAGRQKIWTSNSLSVEIQSSISVTTPEGDFC
jgi:hypothetical protein